MLLSSFFLACEEDTSEIAGVTSLKVVHAADDAPAVYVNHFNEAITFSNYPVVRFGDFERYTIEAGEVTNLTFTYENDTTRQVFSEAVILEAGQISTFFLVGDSANLAGFQLADTGLETLTDSINAVRFVNLAEDVGTINTGLADSTVTLANNLDYRGASNYIKVPANADFTEHTFTFKNQSDSVLSSFRLRQLFKRRPTDPFRPLVFRKSLILALVGRANDGGGNSTLQVVQINNF